MAPVVDVELVNDKGEPAYCREQLKWYEESWDIPKEQGEHLFHTMAQSFYTMLYNAEENGTSLEVTPEQGANK